METKEIWKDITGFEGLYQVSNLGRVKRLEKVLKINYYKKYGRVTLYKDKEKHKYLIHRLVAQAFIPNPDNLPCINHKDENPSNNVVDNLEWCTIEYNNTYGSRKELQKKVLCVELNKVFPSVTQAALWLGNENKKCGIILCCKNKPRKNGCGYLFSPKTAYGYHWRYID